MDRGAGVDLGSDFNPLGQFLLKGGEEAVSVGSGVDGVSRPVAIDL
jgi:hypothetical protein